MKQIQLRIYMYNEYSTWKNKGNGIASAYPAASNGLRLLRQRSGLPSTRIRTRASRSWRGKDQPRRGAEQNLRGRQILLIGESIKLINELAVSKTASLIKTTHHVYWIEHYLTDVPYQNTLLHRLCRRKNIISLASIIILKPQHLQRGTERQPPRPATPGSGEMRRRGHASQDSRSP